MDQTSGTGSLTTFIFGVVVIVAIAILGCVVYRKYFRGSITVSSEDREIQEQQKEVFLPKAATEEPDEESKEEEPILDAKVLVRNAKSQREVISIHVGGAGCNLGSALWELFCVEHDIDPEGYQSAGRTSGMKRPDVI